MADLQLAAQLASIASAMFNAIRFGGELSAWMKKLDPEKVRSDAKILANTYSDAEMKALRDRIHACESRFKREGDGKARARCICSVLQDAKDGNGGSAPVPEWDNMYGTLGCKA